jgi:ribosome-binding factor A
LAGHRNERLSENIREELEELIRYEMSDPRIGNAFIAEVLLSPDLRQAYVRLTLDGSAPEQTATLEALAHGKQFLRHQLTERLQLHRTPDLHFEAALPASLAAKVPQLLKRIKPTRGKPHGNESEKNATP